MLVLLDTQKVNMSAKMKLRMSPQSVLLCIIIMVEAKEIIVGGED